MKIDLFRSQTESVLQGIAKYQTTMELQLDVAAKDEQQRLLDWIQTLDPEDRSAMTEMVRDKHVWTHDFLFRRCLRYSFIVLLFLILENQLYELCDEIKQRRHLPIRAKELSGDAIARCKTYLHKITGITGISEQLWQKVEDLSKVRNCIVHALGKIQLSNDQKRLRDLAVTGQGFSIGGDGLSEKEVILVTPEFCAEATRDVMHLFREIFEAAGFGAAVSMY